LTEHTPQSYSRLVTRFWNQYRFRRILASSVIGVSVVAAVLFAVFFIEQGAYLSPLLRTTLFITAILLGSISFFLTIKIIPVFNRETYYRKVTKETNLSSLRHILDLEEIPRNQDVAFSKAAVAKNLSELAERDIPLEFKKWNSASTAFKMYARGAVALVFLFIGWVTFALTSPETVQRTLTFWEVFEKPNPFTFVVSPANTTIEQGTRFFSEIQFDGAKPSSVFFSVRTENEDEFRSIPMQETTPGRFVSESMEVFSDLEYFIRMDGFSSEHFQITAAQIPRFRELVVRVNPPAYTRVAETSHTYPFSRIEMPEGSHVTITGNANKPLEHAILQSRQLDEANILLENEKDMIWTTAFTVMQPDTLRFELADADGLVNRNPFRFEFRPIRDQHPTIRITQPEPLISKLTPEPIELRFEARDDYGFSSIHLRYEINEAFSDELKRGSVRLSGAAPATVNGVHQWNITTLGLQSADELTYWIEVFDNDRVNGFKSAVSGRQTIRITSLADFFVEQEQREDSIDDALRELARQNEESRRELRELREDILNNPNDNWEQQRQTEELIEQQNQMNEQLQQMMQEFDELRQEMATENVLSEETMRMYQELQQLMQEIDDPEILELLEQLRQGLENLDQQQIRDAMRELEFSEQAYQERLERTMELFKQLRLNAELDKMSALLEQLEQIENRILETEDVEMQQELQQNVADQLEQLQEQIESLPERSPQRRQQMVDEMSQDLGSEMQELRDQVQDNLDELSNPNSSPDQNRQQQEQIRDQISEMRQQMQQMRSQMNQQSINVNIFALKTIFQTLLLISYAQEELNLATLQLEPNSLVFIDHARIQRNISVSFNQVADSLLAVAREVPQLPNMLLRERMEVQRSLDQSIEHLIERNKNRATTSERLALGGINKLAALVADLIDQLSDDQNGNGGGGGMSTEQMMQQMQDMSGQQQQLNQMIQDMINDMAGDRLSQDQMERLDQMARQQNEIRRQLEDLQRRGALNPGDSLLSELERLAEEMEDAINDLRGGSVDPIMVQRQQNILSRMLQAERAMDQREQEERREGTTAEDIQRTSPPEITLEELEREIRNRLQDPNYTRFTEDYERLIRIYFEILREMEQSETLIP